MEQILYWLFIILNDSNIQVRLNITENVYYISSFVIVHDVTWQLQMDNLHVRLNYNLRKEKGIKHHSKKEHNEIRKIAKFGCEILYMFVLRAEIVTIFGSKMVIFLRNTKNIYKICKVIFFRILQHFLTKFRNFTIFNKLFTGISLFCLDLKLV